jgi:hypothetical protein
VSEADSGGGGSDTARSGRDTGAGNGMTGRDTDHLSSAAAREEAELGWRRRFGLDGPR